MRLADKLRPLARYEPWVVLGPLVLVQWLALVAFVVTVKHNGWLFYQGGDQTFFYTSSWIVGHGHIPDAAIGWGWSFVLVPVTWIFGSSFLSALPAVVLIQTVILLPLALVAVYGIAESIGGRLLGYLSAGLWVAMPYAVIPLFDHRYHEKYVEQFLPQALGLTGLGDFPSMVIVLCSAYFVVRALDTRALPDAAAAGLLAGFAIGVKPSNALFLGGALLALAVARRWRAVLAFGAGLALPVIALTLWKARGLGTVPLFGAMGVHLAAGAAPGVVAASNSGLSKYINFDWGELQRNFDGLREFFWSVRVLQWIVIAGFLGVLRRSLPKALLLGGWFAAFLILKGGSSAANIEEGTFFRLFMPGFPPMLIMLASIVLLVPTYGPRLADGFAARRTRQLTWRSPSLVAGAVVLGLIPTLVFLVLPALNNRDAAKYFEENVYVPVTYRSLGLTAKATPGGVVLHWHAPPAHAKVFYRVFRQQAFGVYDYRLPPRIAGVRCLPPAGGAADCSIEMDTLEVTRGRHVRRRLEAGQGPLGLSDRRDGELAERRQRRRRDGRERACDRRVEALVRLVALAEPLLEQREPLRQRHALIGQA